MCIRDRVVTDDNGQFSTSADWASHKHNTNAGKTSEDGVWFGTSEPDDNKGALPYDTYIIEELRSESNKGFELIPPFEIVVSRNNLVIDLGTLTDEYEKEISIHTLSLIHIYEALNELPLEMKSKLSVLFGAMINQIKEQDVIN